MGFGGAQTVCDRHGLRDEAGALRHLQAEGCRGGEEALLKLVRVATSYAGAKRRTARADGPSSQHGRGSLPRDPGQMGSRVDDHLHGGTQQLVLDREAQGPRVSVCGIHDHHALLRRRETYPTVLLTH